MREFFINYSMKTIKKQFVYSDDKLDEIKYGLEGLYILITKSLIIFSIAALLGIVKELLILLLFFNILRFTGFGLHAKSSLKCLISSTTVFIGITFFCKFIIIPFELRLMICIFCLVSLILYAPADTEKRPLINKNKRVMYKIISIATGIIYTLLQFVNNNSFLINTATFSMVIECVLINPFVYKVLGFRYSNYKYYEEL